jgi:uncharacterized protein YbaA (DUF1428 family)
VDAQEGETIVFSWIVWPSREVRDAGNKKLMEDRGCSRGPTVPFDMKRLIFGGFAPILQARRAADLEIAERELA